MDKIKKNNKGFTLVELIVVVAILAVITVVVAPQYLEYVEKARIGTDENTIGEIAHVAEITFVEKKASDDSFAGYEVTVTVDAKGKFDITTNKDEGAATGKALSDEIEKVVNPNQYVFKSKEYKGTNDTKITIDSTGVATWTKADGTQMGGKVSTGEKK